MKRVQDTFQFQNGAIERLKFMKTLTTPTCFNSKMVRLREVNRIAHLCYICKFQFQNGAIESKIATEELPYNSIKFQFQNGAIESKHGNGCSLHSTWFQFQNGAIERFKPVMVFDRNKVFQFQNGAIEREYQRGIYVTFQRFNSKMVRLRAKILSEY